MIYAALAMGGVFLIFNFQIIREWLKSHFRRESQSFAFDRVENVYPKFKL